jgi:hypothetical protein
LVYRYSPNHSCSSGEEMAGSLPRMYFEGIPEDSSRRPRG